MAKGNTCGEGLGLGRRDFLKLMPLSAASLGALASAQPSSSIMTIPTLGAAPQLFVDFDRVERLENVQQVFHSVEKHPGNPVLRREKPWERELGSWYSVTFDTEEKIFKVWYGGDSGTTHEVAGDKAPNTVLCYAVSPDGVHWERPNLRQYEIMGTKDNNVVLDPAYHDGMGHWESVVKDPMATSPDKRYKALGWSSYDWNGPLSGIYAMTSPDGLHWTTTAEPIVHFHPRKGTADLGPIGDAQALMIDTLQHRYAALLRATPDRKMSVSKDFVTWSAPQICMKARAGEDNNTLYNHLGFVYGDQYLGFLSYFARDPVNPLVTVRLISSRDGENWDRPNPEKPLIPVGDIGDFDRFNIRLTGAAPTRVADKLYIYYRSTASRHNPYKGKDTSVEGGGMGLALLRVDGFASLDATYEGGKVTTRPFMTQGKELRVNAKANFGKLQAEVIDEQDVPVPGFTRDECEPIHVDSCNCPVRWKENSTLGKLQGRPIRLRFYLQNVRFYSYWITA
jgi:hypothetical protein